jgi:DNA replication initiation complex subunit (GINS family)
MGEVAITFETVFEMLRREKNREDLQELDPTFYQDVQKFLTRKQTEISSAGSMEDQERIRIESTNVKKILRDLYERREKKVLDMAMIKARTQGALTNKNALLPSEASLFESIHGLLSQSRTQVLNPLLLGASPPTMLSSPVSTPIPPPQPSTTLPTSSLKPSIQPTPPPSLSAPLPTTSPSQHTPSPPSSTPTTPLKTHEQASSSKESTKSTESFIKSLQTIRFIQAIPKFVGPQLEIYGPYNQGDTADLPGVIANILIEKKQAQLALEGQKP